MSHSVEFVRDMTDALAFMDSVAVFYAKYHILDFRERCVLAHKLRETHREWARCGGIEQRHVDFLQVLTSEMSMHFEEWLQDHLVSHKRWCRHPRDDLSDLLTQSANIIARMEDVIVSKNRRLSALEEKKTAWG